MRRTGRLEEGRVDRLLRAEAVERRHRWRRLLLLRLEARRKGVIGAVAGRLRHQLLLLGELLLLEEVGLLLGCRLLALKLLLLGLVLHLEVGLLLRLLLRLLLFKHLLLVEGLATGPGDSYPSAAGSDGGDSGRRTLNCDW